MRYTSLLIVVFLISCVSFGLKSNTVITVDGGEVVCSNTLLIDGKKIESSNFCQFEYMVNDSLYQCTIEISSLPSKLTSNYIEANCVLLGIYNHGKK